MCRSHISTEKSLYKNVQGSIGHFQVSAFGLLKDNLTMFTNLAPSIDHPHIRYILNRNVASVSRKNPNQQSRPSDASQQKKFLPNGRKIFIDRVMDKL